MLKTCVYHHELDRFPILKDIFDPMDGELNKCDLFFIYISYDKICQHLDDLHNSVNQYFPTDPCTMH